MDKNLPQKKANRLIGEKSPYLLQHAYNPVDWYAWNEGAFQRAQTENKPIFLSIGYSTCHWCHVMEKESFEDIELAKKMNETFVCIKVDREERPDIDNLYMTVSRITTGGGGWPLTVIMTPDKKPFFIGTYLPKTSRDEIIGMNELVDRVKEIWSTQRESILKSAEQISNSLHIVPKVSGTRELGNDELNKAFESLASNFDWGNGGFGYAPKFPSPHNLLFLLRYWKRTGNAKALEMVEKALQAMRFGGIYDHVGFGFHRYSTDAEWHVPHFEKMLYDQALLAMAYTEAYQATKDETYKNTAEEVLSYVLRELTSTAGGFYTAVDADSEGEEGKFYMWTEDEIRNVLNEKESEVVTKLFGVKKGEQNVFHINKESLETLNENDSEILSKVLEKLFNAREKRVHPERDDKILTDWNGLIMAAFAKASQAFGEPKYADAARRAADFILDNMHARGAKLLHRYRDEEAAMPANIDDYAFLVWGLLELYEATFDLHYLRNAIALNKDVIEHFWDEKNGGFFFSSDENFDLIARNKEIYDGALPSGNSVAMLNMLRLARITGDDELEKKAIEIGKAFADDIEQYPSVHSMLMCAVDFAVGPSHEIVVAGNLFAEDLKAMVKSVRELYLPNKVLLFRPGDQDDPNVAELAPFTKEQKSIDNKATAYVCTNRACQKPTTDIKEVIEQLK